MNTGDNVPRRAVPVRHVHINVNTPLRKNKLFMMCIIFVYLLVLDVLATYCVLKNKAVGPKILISVGF
jgi:hypothetical protein